MADEKRTCMECGQLFKPSEMLKVGRKMYCKPCAEAILNDNSAKSNNSGNSINIVNQQINNSDSTSGKKIVVKNHTTALVLSILLGWLGADRFYVKHSGLALLKLFTLGGYGVWWVIDIILFATKNINYVKWE